MGGHPIVEDVIHRSVMLASSLRRVVQLDGWGRFLSAADWRKTQMVDHPLGRDFIHLWHSDHLLGNAPSRPRVFIHRLQTSGGFEKRWVHPSAEL